MAKLNWYGDKAIKSMDQAISIALEASGLIVEGQAKALCPVDSGRLRNSISYSIDGKVEGLNKAGKRKKGKQEASSDDGVKPNPAKDTVVIGTNVEYGPHVELGTVKMEAQPYLNPALDRNKKNIAKIFAQTIAEVMRD